MLRRSGAVVVVVLMLFGCADKQATGELEAQIERVRHAIEENKADRLKYGEGSALHVLVGLTVATHEQTLAMLEQKLAAVRWYPAFRYTVNGAVYERPADADARMKTIEKAVAKLDLDVLRDSTKTTGILGMLATLRSELKQVEMAQLEYEHTALRFHFPAMIGQFRVPDQIQACK